MKILVVPRKFIIQNIEKNPDWILGKWIISIFSSNSYSPISDRFNILKLNFDDIAERDLGSTKNSEIFFNENHAKKIHEFIKNINIDNVQPIYIHCDAGVSRSGAVGYILNEYFNKFLRDNNEDNEFFKRKNSHILPNPLVVRILKKELFGLPFRGIEVNDYSFNEEGERIDNIEKI